MRFALGPDDAGYVVALVVVETEDDREYFEASALWPQQGRRTHEAARRTGADAALVGSLAWRFPALRVVLDEHLFDNDFEILPHLVMADYERWAEETCECGDGATLRGFLEALEDAYAHGGAQAQELIAVSFLENLPRPGERAAQLRDLIGPRLREQLDAFEKWTAR